VSDYKKDNKEGYLRIKQEVFEGCERGLDEIFAEIDNLNRNESAALD
jgi:hypothetical protein